MLWEVLFSEVWEVLFSEVANASSYDILLFLFSGSIIGRSTVMGVAVMGVVYPLYYTIPLVFLQFRLVPLKHSLSLSSVLKAFRSTGCLLPCQIRMESSLTTP